MSVSIRITKEILVILLSGQIAQALQAMVVSAISGWDGSG